MLISSVRDDLCLNFANTLSWRGSASPQEMLHDLAGLLAWLKISAEVASGDALDVPAFADGSGSTATAVFTKAMTTREVIFRVFSAIAAGSKIRGSDFRALQDALANAPPRRHLERVGSDYVWRIASGRLSEMGILAPVIWSAGDLVLNAKHRRIRQCANEQCLWLFIDESKNATRRWCDMTSCGNRAKSQRHYARIKQQERGEAAARSRTRLRSA